MHVKVYAVVKVLVEDNSYEDITLITTDLNEAVLEEQRIDRKPGQMGIVEIMKLNISGSTDRDNYEEDE